MTPGAKTEASDYVELEPCPRCGGAGSYRWYLGDELNSQGDSECEICEGTGWWESEHPNLEV